MMADNQLRESGVLTINTTSVKTKYLSLHWIPRRDEEMAAVNAPNTESLCLGDETKPNKTEVK